MPQAKAPKPPARGRPSAKGDLQAIFGPGRNITKKPVVTAPGPGASPPPAAAAQAEPAPAAPKLRRAPAPKAPAVRALATVPTGEHSDDVTVDERIARSAAGDSVERPLTLPLSPELRRALKSELRRDDKNRRKVVEVFLELLPADCRELKRIEDFLRQGGRNPVRTRIIRLALAAFQESPAMLKLYDDLKTENDQRLSANRAKPINALAALHDQMTQVP